MGPQGPSGTPTTASVLTSVKPFMALRPGLALACVGTAVVEACLLLLAGPTSALPLAPQISAPAPLGVFHDLRWLDVYHNSWWGFGVELAALVVFRSMLDAVIVTQAWPRHRLLPPFGKTLARMLLFTAFAVVALLPWTTLLFGLAVAPISWLFLVALPPVIVVASLLHHGAVSRDWWRQLPSLASLGWVLASFAILTVAGGLISAGPPLLAVPLAAVVGMGNALCWRQIVASLIGGRGLRRAPLVPPFGALAMVGIVLGGAAAGFGAQSAHPPPRPLPSGGSGSPVLVVAGFGTSWDGRSSPPALGNHRTSWFSYRGVDATGAPLPYRSDDTLQSLPSLDGKMATQVAVLHNSTRAPVAIVAVSEGTLVAKTYLATAQAPVHQLVLVSPVIGPGRVYYPPKGFSGWGVASGWGLSVFTNGLHAVSDIDITPTTPLFRSIVEEGPRLRATLAKPLAGLRQTAITPLADAVANPEGTKVGAPTIVVLGFHNGTLGDPRILATVTALLDGRTVTQRSWDAAEVAISRAAAAWQVPALQPSLNSVWAGHT